MITIYKYNFQLRKNSCRVNYENENKRNTPIKKEKKIRNKKEIQLIIYNNKKNPKKIPK